MPRVRAIAYVRQSRRADLDLALSYDAQVAAIGRLAERDGVDPATVTIHSDMGRSGGAGKEHLRTGYQAVMAAIEAGEVDTVYALSLTRLARSTSELYRMMTVAQERKVRLVFAKEGELNPAAPLGKVQFGIMAVFAEFERDLAVERALDNAAVRRARGERMGRQPYEDMPGAQPDAVVAAWIETRSLDGAALLLNHRGIPSTLGKGWRGRAVRNFLRRYRPDLLPPFAPRKGVKPSSPFLFFQLLRCSCGTTLTGSRDPRGNRAPRYRCHSARTRPGHPHPFDVNEDIVRPWAEAEAARYEPPVDSVELAAADEDERSRLDGRRLRVIDNYEDGIYGNGLPAKAERDRRLLPIEDALAALGARRVVAEVPDLDWQAPPEYVNAVLRALWRYVEMGPDMRPVRAVWTTET